MTRVRKHLLVPRYAWPLLKPGIYSRLRKRREKRHDQKRCAPGCEKSFKSLWPTIALKQWAMRTDTFWWRLSARWSLLTKRKKLVLSTIVSFNFHRYPRRSYRASADSTCDTALLVNMLALLRHLAGSRPDVVRCPADRGASFLLKPSMKPMRARSTSSLRHWNTEKLLDGSLQKRRLRWTTECVLEALTAITSTLPSAICGKRLSIICLEVRCLKPSWCTTFGFWTAASILCGTSTSRSCSMVRCRKKFRLEDGMRSRGPVSNTVKLSANQGKRDIHDPLECPLLEAVMVCHLRHLDKLECRGTARRFAAECDPVECVSAQRGG